MCLAWVAGKLVLDLRTAMFERLLSVPARFNDANPSPKLISKVTYDANQVMEAGTFVVTVLIKDSLPSSDCSLGWRGSIGNSL